MNENPILMSRAGNEEPLHLTKSQVACGLSLSDKWKVLNESTRKVSWRALIRAVLSGYFELVPTKKYHREAAEGKKPAAAPLPVEVARGGCPKEPDLEEMLARW